MVPVIFRAIPTRAEDGVREGRETGGELLRRARALPRDSKGVSRASRAEMAKEI